MCHMGLEGPIACMFSSPNFPFDAKPTIFAIGASAVVPTLEKNKIEEACAPWSMPLKESSFPGITSFKVVIFNSLFLHLPIVGTSTYYNYKDSSDVPMAQYIINMNASMPASDKFIIHVLDSTHMFVQPHVELMIRSQIAKFREDNTYVKPN
ncbi:hypothetical protein ACSQ67_005270 [Phaseolus vulgaris]